MPLHPFRPTLEAQANTWEQHGRPVSELLKGWTLMVASCWSYSPGARNEPPNELAQAFLAASRNANPGYDEIYNERDTCRGCGERYRIENLGICTRCSALWCYRCQPGDGQHPNGNSACACGGEVVG
ncbi:MAG: hypothetical protein AB4911_05945 [Oscillochloridaceae bacterium umkhey_bin13]